MYEEFNSKKYIILLVFICIIFTIFVVKAFDYLPEKQELSSVQNINTIAQSTSIPENSNNDVVQNEDTPKKNQKSGVLYKNEYGLHEEISNNTEKTVKSVSAPEMTIIDEEIPNPDNYVKESTSENKLSNEELALKCIINARKYVNADELSKAIEEYQKVAELTSDKELLAESYDGISYLYAKNKRYSTALSFAGKAYSSSPSLAREFFIAKVYYMAGQTDTAISRINSMLKRGLK